jgi:2-oxoglutarate dehydrogenase complex dehydrogenase (E1) component-like enzyme
MGAWRYIVPHLRRLTGHPVLYAGREEAASPAVGSKNVSDQELHQFTERAFSL